MRRLQERVHGALRRLRPRNLSLWGCVAALNSYPLYEALVGRVPYSGGGAETRRESASTLAKDFDALFERGAAWFRQRVEAAKSAFAVWNEPNRTTPAKTPDGRTILPNARGHWLLSTPDDDSWGLLPPEHRGTAAAVRLLHEFRESEVADVPLGLAIWLTDSPLTIGHAREYLRACHASLSSEKVTDPGPNGPH